MISDGLEMAWESFWQVRGGVGGRVMGKKKKMKRVVSRPGIANSMSAFLYRNRYGNHDVQPGSPPFSISRAAKSDAMYGRVVFYH